MNAANDHASLCFTFSSVESASATVPVGAERHNRTNGDKYFIHFASIPSCLLC